MFDSVGRNIDPEANKRRAASLVLLMVLGGSVTGAGFIAAAWKATEVVIDMVTDDVELVELDMEEATIDEALPPPPPPPPPPPAAQEDAGDEDEDEDDETPDNPDEMVEEIQELDTQVQERMASQDRPQGVVGGVEGGVEGGVVGGVIGGVEGGVLGGQLGGSVATVHHSELQIKRRVDPEYPEAARDMNLGIVDCRVRIFIDEEGVPYDLVFESCPRVFHENARDAVMKTRWYPHRVGRSKSRAQFVIRYRFVPRR